MDWPQSQDYNEAIQNPESSFGDPELRGGKPVTNAMGMPMPRSGNFADVYEFEGASGAKWAVKCFTRHVPGLQARYSEISGHLLQANLQFMVGFQYLEEGIRMRGHWYPILKMQWVEGFLLNEFVRDHLDRPPLLKALGKIWGKMAQRLREHGIAHADLQHGNVILVPGSRADSLAIKLIDYDGMFVPTLAPKRSGEVGHPCYQHPQRSDQGLYNAEVDRLPLLAIACALHCLTFDGKSLWKRYDNGDNLLFREEDLRRPAESEVLRDLWCVNDATAHDLVGNLTLALLAPLNQTPLLTDIFTDYGTVPLTASQEEQVSTLLGRGAQIIRPVVPLPIPAHAVPMETTADVQDDTVSGPLKEWGTGSDWDQAAPGTDSGAKPWVAMTGTFIAKCDYCRTRYKCKERDLGVSKCCKTCANFFTLVPYEKKSKVASALLPKAAKLSSFTPAPKTVAAEHAEAPSFEPTEEPDGAATTAGMAPPKGETASPTQGLAELCGLSALALGSIAWGSAPFASLSFLTVPLGALGLILVFCSWFMAMAPSARESAVLWGAGVVNASVLVVVLLFPGWFGVANGAAARPPDIAKPAQSN